jgi:hypothetical protein
LRLEVNGTISINLHGLINIFRSLWKSDISNQDISFSIYVCVNFEKSIFKEVRDDYAIDNPVYKRLEKFVHQNLNWKFKEISDPSNNIDHEISRKLYIGICKVEISIEKVYNRSSRVRVSFKWKTIVKSCILKVYVNIERIFNGPKKNVKTFEMNVPALDLGPIHHNTIFFGVNRELGTLSVDSKVSDSNISDLKESKEQIYLFWHKWCNDIIDNIRKLIEELFTDKIYKWLFCLELNAWEILDIRLELIRVWNSSPHGSDNCEASLFEWHNFM